MKQEIFFLKEINNSTKKVINLAKNYLKNSGSDKFLLDFQKINLKNDCENRIKDVLYEHLLKCESLSPGASEIALNRLINYQTTHVADQHKVKTFNKNSLEKLLKTFSSQNIGSLTFEALDLAGLKGKVLLSTTNSNVNDDVIELTSGSFFSGVESMFDLTSTKFLHAKVACVDGYIESVSEIHKVLEQASESKETLIIFLRGLSNEVIHTLKVNYDRGTLRVIPIITKFDVDGSNILNDIAVVSGCDVVSSLKGQLFSSIDVPTLPRVDSVDITSLGVMIENSSTNSNVDRHISFLQKKILSSDSDFVRDVLTKRLQQLGMSRVTIKLINDRNKLKKSFMIDRCLRAVKTATTYGVIEYNEKLYPYSSLLAGSLYANKFLNFIENLGAVVV